MRVRCKNTTVYKMKGRSGFYLNLEEATGYSNTVRICFHSALHGYIPLIQNGDWFYCTTTSYEDGYEYVDFSRYLDESMENLKSKRPVVEGVSKDAPTVTNDKGGKQSKVIYGMDCLPPKAILDVARTLEEGRQKYGKDNWRQIEIGSHLNHALIHMFAYMAGDTSDDHLNHATCRLMFALELHLGE
jgi:hypothetical protein